jgi:hypothetical protein
MYFFLNLVKSLPPRVVGVRPVDNYEDLAITGRMAGSILRLQHGPFTFQSVAVPPPSRCNLRTCKLEVVQDKSKPSKFQRALSFGRGCPPIRLDSLDTHSECSQWSYIPSDALTALDLHPEFESNLRGTVARARQRDGVSWFDAFSRYADVRATAIPEFASSIYSRISLSSKQRAIGILRDSAESACPMEPTVAIFRHRWLERSQLPDKAPGVADSGRRIEMIFNMNYYPCCLMRRHD